MEHMSRVRYKLDIFQISQFCHKLKLSNNSTSYVSCSSCGTYAMYVNQILNQYLKIKSHFLSYQIKTYNSLSCVTLSSYGTVVANVQMFFGNLFQTAFDESKHIHLTSIPFNSIRISTSYGSLTSYGRVVMCVTSADLKMFWIIDTDVLDWYIIL